MFLWTRSTELDFVENLIVKYKEITIHPSILLPIVDGERLSVYSVICERHLRARIILFDPTGFVYFSKNNNNGSDDNNNDNKVLTITKIITPTTTTVRGQRKRP